jgi:hypothetical protein
MVFSTFSFAQDGHHGVGHDSWHESFYSKLIRKDTKTSCCNLSDCRPTQSRMVDDHYEVKVDGDWLPVPKEAIQNISAPDGGAHVCAPRQVGRDKGTIYCVVLPPETWDRHRQTGIWDLGVVPPNAITENEARVSQRAETASLAGGRIYQLRSKEPLGAIRIP